MRRRSAAPTDYVRQASKLPTPITGDDVRRIRAAYDLSQEELADRLDLTRSQVANIEGGRRELGRLRTYLLTTRTHCPHFLGGRPKLGPRAGGGSDRG